jgi:hypothetical protein
MPRMQLVRSHPLHRLTGWSCFALLFLPRTVPPSMLQYIFRNMCAFGLTLAAAGWMSCLCQALRLCKAP